MTTSAATYTWPSVLALVPAPTKDEAERYAIETPHADLIERGARIRSEKILTDLVRFGGILGEFWSRATSAQKKHLLGFSAPLLSVMVYSGKTLIDMLALRDTSKEDREANRAAAIAIADQAYQEGIDERERIVTALEGVQNLEPGLAEKLAAARGRVVDAASLAASLDALAKLSAVLIANAGSKVALQLADGGLDANVIADIEAVAAKVKTTGAAADGARMQGSLTQADLDLQDGICLAYMDRVMRVINRAHDRDPSIPKLTPIASRHMFSSSRKQAADTEAAEPSPGNATP